jgi:hypothetical protein
MTNEEQDKRTIERIIGDGVPTIKHLNMRLSGHVIVAKRQFLAAVCHPAELSECPFLAAAGCFTAARNGSGSPALIGVERGLA